VKIHKQDGIWGYGKDATEAGVVYCNMLKSD